MHILRTCLEMNNTMVTRLALLISFECDKLSVILILQNSKLAQIIWLKKLIDIIQNLDWNLHYELNWIQKKEIWFGHKPNHNFNDVPPFSNVILNCFQSFIHYFVLFSIIFTLFWVVFNHLYIVLCCFLSFIHCFVLF